MRWIIAAITVLISLHATVARGTETGERAMLELVINGARRGEAIVLLLDDDVLVPLQSLVEAGLTRLETPTQDHGGVPHVSLRSASLPFHLR